MTIRERNEELAREAGRELAPGEMWTGCAVCHVDDICCGAPGEPSFCSDHCDCWSSRKARGETRYNPDDCGLDGPDFDVPPEADGDTDDPTISPFARHRAYV